MLESKSIAVRPVRGHLSCLKLRPVIGLQKIGVIEALLGFSAGLALGAGLQS